MYINNKYIEDLDDNDIKALLENKIRESKTLEYKRQLNISDDKDKSKLEFICDIISLYNTEGGCIIYGIQEGKDDKNKNTGYPIQLYHQNFDQPDALILQIQSIIKYNTAPSIINIIIRFIKVDEITVMIIGVPKGLGLPTMVTLNEANKFYKRNNNGKYAVDVYELNQLFMQHAGVRENAVTFQANRIKDVLSGTIYPTVNTQGGFFLHAIPIDFQKDNLVDFSVLRGSELSESIEPIRFYTDLDETYPQYQSSYNYDGFMTSFRKAENSSIYSYNQFFRNGIIEFFTGGFYEPVSLENGKRTFLYGDALVKGTIECIKKAIIIWKTFKIEPPFLILIQFNAPAAILLVGSSHSVKITRNPITLPVIYFEKFNLTTEDIFQQMVKYFDIIWQAAGQRGCPPKKSFFES